MNLSTQLRIILLLVGAAIWLAIYLFGKRRTSQSTATMPAVTDVSQTTEAPGFMPAEDVGEDEFETPAYMRRQGQREPRQDYEPRIANAHDYVDMDEVRDDDRLVDDDRDQPQAHATNAVREHQPTVQPQRVQEFDEPVYVEPAPNDVMLAGRREPTVTFDEFVVADNPATDYQESDPVAQDELSPAIAAEPPTLPNIPVVEYPVNTAAQSYAPRAEPVSDSASKPAPTLSEAVPAPAERVASHAAPVASQSAAAPTPAASTSGPSSNAARRKIIALRIPMPERVPGAQLLGLLQGERLQHGKFNIFHRLQNAGTVFSVASMVEPGTFDPQAMSEQQFPGVTLFMLLPGPVDGLVAWDQMLSCAQRIAHATGGLLQDERGSKLTPQTMEKLREEVLDFQHLIGGTVTAT